MLFRAVSPPVQVWSVQLGVILEDLPLHSDFVNCVLFSPSAPHILSAADNGLIKVSYSGYFLWCVIFAFFSQHQVRSANNSTAKIWLTHIHMHVALWLYRELCHCCNSHFTKTDKGPLSQSVLLLSVPRPTRASTHNKETTLKFPGTVVCFKECKTKTFQVWDRAEST